MYMHMFILINIYISVCTSRSFNRSVSGCGASSKRGRKQPEPHCGT